MVILQAPHYSHISTQRFAVLAPVLSARSGYPAFGAVGRGGVMSFVCVLKYAPQQHSLGVVRGGQARA